MIIVPAAERRWTSSLCLFPQRGRENGGFPFVARTRQGNETSHRPPLALSSQQPAPNPQGHIRV